MSSNYTVADLDSAIAGFATEEAGWSGLVDRLVGGPVNIPGIGMATHVDNQEEERNYYNEGNLWVVISVEDNRGTRYFRREGHYSSYDGGKYYGPTTEVKKGKIVRVNWERV